MPKYRRRPFEVEAVQWTGSNLGEIEALGVSYSRWGFDHEFLRIETIVDAPMLKEGDWLVKSPSGYCIKPKYSFISTHELVRE